MKKTTKKIAIIGGGASGMMAGAAILESGFFSGELYLFEANRRLGEKVRQTGGGRCNVTTSITDKKLLFSKYVRGSDFLKKAIGRFPPEKIMSWFENHGVPLKIEEDSRVFPVSDNGNDIVAVFERIFTESNLRFHFSEPVTSLARVAGKNLFSLKTEKGDYEFDTVILTTGGSFPRKTNDGYSLAESLGHSVTGLAPSLTSFEIRESWPKKLAGVTFPEVELRAVLPDGTVVKSIGSMLFTHTGITGPAVFALSAKLAFESISENETLEVSFSPIAGLDFKGWDAGLRTVFEREGVKQAVTIIAEVLPKRFAEKILDQSFVSREKRAAEISREGRVRISKLLSGELTLTLVGRTPGVEMVTAGGVELSEIEVETMESKITEGLYLAGEILNVDGVTGGFNLTAAWATGYLAGLSATANIRV